MLAVMVVMVVVVFGAVFRHDHVDFVLALLEQATALVQRQTVGRQLVQLTREETGTKYTIGRQVRTRAPYVRDNLALAEYKHQELS